MDLEDRFQFKPWYVKLWRLRFYIYIPIDTLQCWFFSKAPIKECLMVSKGLAQANMNWVYTTEEVRKKMKWIKIWNNFLKEKVEKK